LISIDGFNESEKVTDLKKIGCEL